jgi:hypothetical protein
MNAKQVLLTGATNRTLFGANVGANNECAVGASTCCDMVTHKTWVYKVCVCLLFSFAGSTSLLRFVSPFVFQLLFLFYFSREQHSANNSNGNNNSNSNNPDSYTCRARRCSLFVRVCV